MTTEQQHGSSLAPPQEVIMANWEPVDIQVTVVVPTFNHAPYLDQAMKGILGQKTSFPFKVVVYDDASTDGTSDIVKGYQQRYPEIVDAYIASFNHYSQDIPRTEHFSLLRGEYIAYCEGDDYWINEDKLQIQFDLLERYDVNLCVHPAIIYFEESGRTDLFCSYGDKLSLLSPQLTYKLKNQFAPTASYFLRQSCHASLQQFMEERRPGYGDFFIEALCGEKPYLYTPEVMSVYRRGHIGSYSANTSRNQTEELQRDFDNSIHNLNLLHKFIMTNENLLEERRLNIEKDFCQKMLSLHGPIAQLHQRLETINRSLGTIQVDEYISPLKKPHAPN
ncbi:glycosyltransferase family 2 protein [Salinicola salarius]|uniref:glycosyltransferase family 2 protein n=1 Tax=Salinicola salarius TaxID=430457 RepID=UPI000DA25191|nr:glycosyltransferase family 2 protein [Salinicola salarius]